MESTEEFKHRLSFLSTKSVLITERTKTQINPNPLFITSKL